MSPSTGGECGHCDCEDFEPEVESLLSAKASAKGMTRDAMRDRMHDAFEEYSAARAAALKTLREAHDKVVEELIAAEAWLKDQGLDDRPGDEYPLTWPDRFEEEGLRGLVDFGSEFDEMTANLEEAIEKAIEKQKLAAVARANFKSTMAAAEARLYSQEALAKKAKGEAIVKKIFGEDAD
jgi:hypothetical protein